MNSNNHENTIKNNNVFICNGVEYFFDVNPINGKPMLARVDRSLVSNRKEICRIFLLNHGWNYSDFGNKTTNELEREIIKIISNSENTKSKKISTTFYQKNTFNNASEQELNTSDKELADYIKSKAHPHSFNYNMVEEVLNAMSKKNHFFVSEAHLQTEFIIEASRLYPDFEFYPELAPSEIPHDYLEHYGGGNIYFDLVIRSKTGETTLLEFKYLTVNYLEITNGFHYEVKHQSAQNMRRYDCWHDISRIEMFVNGKHELACHGYFVLVTNDASYWKYRETNCIDAMFRMFDGLHKAETKFWKQTPGKGTLKGREVPILITKDYYFEYKNFYDSKKRNGLFKYLIVPID